MTQLSQKQVAEIIEGIERSQPIRDRKSHKWVTEDGVYDDTYHHLRLFIWNGFNYLVASRLWVEDPVANTRLPIWMQAPWGSYPALPSKPSKN